MSSVTLPNDWYVLKGRIPVKVESVEEWSRQARKYDKRIARDELADGTVVSTVFLGLDHSFTEGPPLLFETLVFGGPHDGHMERCSTWEEAEKQHKIIVTLAAAGAEP